jgi:hypothetical protein
MDSNTKEITPDFPPFASFNVGSVDVYEPSLLGIVVTVTV